MAKEKRKNMLTTDQGTITYDCDISGRVITESTEGGVKPKIFGQRHSSQKSILAVSVTKSR